MIRLLMSAVLGAMLALPAAALDLSSMDEAEREAFGKAVRAYLLENPQVIMDAVAVLEQREAAQQAQADLALVAQHQKALFDDGFSFVGGNPEGDLTLVEFLDYRCGYCRKAHPEVAKLLDTDGNIRLIVKEFPILGEQSVIASRFAIATRHIAGDAAYKAVSDTLISYGGAYSDPALTRIAANLGLDPAPILAQMNSPEVTAEIQATRALAQQLGISGTPTFVIGDDMVRGYVPYDQMLLIVEELRG